MAFVSIYVPNFVVQAIGRSDPSLLHRPLALVDPASSIGTVIGLNKSASEAGIKLGMTRSQVQRFDAIEIRSRSVAQEKAAHAALLDLGWSVSPRIEDTAADTIVADVAGLSSLFSSEDEIARQLAKGASRLGLTTQVASASSIDVVILAARAFAGITVISPGEEAAIIGKVPIATLLPSPEILETLDRWGVHTCADFAALPLLQLSERLGQKAIRLHDLASGRSKRAMVVTQPAARFEEEMELEYAVEEIEPLAFLMARMLDQLCARLTSRSLGVGGLQVRFCLAPPSDRSIARVEHDNSQNCLPTSFEKILRLPVPISDPKLLLKLLILNLQADPPSAPIVRIILNAMAARPRVSQRGLFSLICSDPEKAELTVARLAKLLGPANLGSAELLDTNRPEGFRMRPFDSGRESDDLPRPAWSSPCMRSATAKAGILESEDESLTCSFRVFRPAMPAKVEIQEECPVRVGFSGVRGKVVAASGPWCGSGDWWREDAWDCSEWDIEIHPEGGPPAKYLQPASSPGGERSQLGGVYRIFYDRSLKEWFVRGAYD